MTRLSLSSSVLFRLCGVSESEREAESARLHSLGVARWYRTKVRRLGRQTARRLETISTRAQTSV